MINVTVKTKRVIYEFSIQDKYTIVGGDSATGKSTLCELVEDRINGDRSVQIKSAVTVETVTRQDTAEDYKRFFSRREGYIMLIDETYPILHIHGFEKILNEAPCYFIIFYRDKKLNNLSVSLDSLCIMHESGKYYTFSPNT